MIYQDSTYRIEHFFDGRPVTIWELRNPFIAKKIIQAIVNFQYKSGVMEVIKDRVPFDREKVGVDLGIDEWAPAAQERITKIRQLIDKQEDKTAFSTILETVDQIEKLCLFDGY